MKSALAGGCALAAIVVALPANAQTSAATTPRPAARPAGDTTVPGSPQVDAEGGLVDIVVTAQRRSESAQRAGIAISVVSGNDVIAQGVTQPDQLGRLVPALSIQNQGGANVSAFVRGVGNFTVNGYSDPAIAVNYDGVYLARPTSFAGLFYDLERVEVLKGPQGTLYGRNATGGAINVLPVKPHIGELSGFATAGYGNYDAYILQGAINVPLGDKGALRVSGTLTGHDGYLSDGTSDEKAGAMRIQMLGELTPDLTVRTAFDYSHAGGRGTGSNYAGIYNFNTATGKYDFSPAGLGPSVGVLDPRSQAYRQSLFIPTQRNLAPALDDSVYLNNDFYGANAEIGWKTGIGTLTVIPAWRYANIDTRFDVPAFIGYTTEKDEQYSLEARFNGNRVGIFDYVVGAYLFRETDKGKYNFSQTTLAAYQQFTNTVQSNAVFGRLTANLSDRLRAIGGIRYTDDHKTFNGRADVLLERCIGPNLAFVTAACAAAPYLPVTLLPGQLPAPFVVPTVPGVPVPLAGFTIPGPALILAPTVVNTKLNSSRVTWHGGLEFDLGPRSLAYASVETGYRSGGFSLSYGYETYQPEYITAYTIGVKNRFFENRVQLNVEGFYWKYRNQQLSHTGLDKNGNSGVFTENVGRSTIKGAEVEMQVLATKSTILRGDVQYLDATYDSFIFTQAAAATPGNALTGCPQTAGPGALFTVNCSGYPAFNAPKWTVNLSAQQTVPLGGVKLVASVDTQYRTSRYVQVNYLPQMLAPADWTTNAQLTLAESADKWSITGFVRNIENKRRVVSTQLFPAINTLTELRTAPRTYGVRASVTF